VPTVRGQAAGSDVRSQGVVGGEPAERVGERLRVTRRDEERALAVDEQLARGRACRR
jgi:hypothetical protein